MDDDKNDYNPEEEVVTGNWNTPKVELKEVEIKTGEEDESLFWSGRSKLYRWVEGEWKERGLGESKLLLHKKKGIIRFLLRQEKTLKVVANHYIYPNESYCKLVPNAGSEKIYAWTVKDFAEEPKIEQFALKFNTADAAKLFKQKFDEAGQVNLKLLDSQGNLKEKVEEKKDDDKKEKKDDNSDNNKKTKEDEEEKKDKVEKDEKKKEDEKENVKKDVKEDDEEKKDKVEKDEKKKEDEKENVKKDVKEDDEEKDKDDKTKDDDTSKDEKEKEVEQKEDVKEKEEKEKEKDDKKSDDKKSDEEENIKRED
ncbi:ran binding protein 1, putative [Plasmodium sp. gorilla clade G1]|nr:ran binding protein 1, putative [Plasmodium sp. gorilla clade G1]